MTRFTTYEGNVRTIPFQLRQQGVRGVWDVSGATQIRLEVTGPAPDGPDLTPIVCNSAHPQADWLNGLVIAVIDATNVTALIGTYTFSLTVDIGGEVITSTTGVIEVLDRPGYTAP